MNENTKNNIENLGDNHVGTSIETPMKGNAFDKSDDQKIASIQSHFQHIMEDLGLDITDDSLSGTPYRFAKMYVKELFYCLDPKNKPVLTTFSNKYGYNKMLIEQNITIDSTCEHHFLPITGFAHVAYIAEEKVIGLSKINRLVNYYAHRPQVQERLTEQVYYALQCILETDNIAVVTEGVHYCVKSRGIRDTLSSTITSKMGGCFKTQDGSRKEFLSLVNSDISKSNSHFLHIFFSI